MNLFGQRALLVLALAAGALAGTLYYVGAQRVSVIVAARDLDATHALSADDLITASFPPESIPPGAITDQAQAVGRIPRAPLWRGQVLLANALGAEAASFHTGLAIPPGMRAVALPVAAPQAVGGAIVPGARVDVLAVPGATRAASARPVEVIARSALVLDVRGESGGPYGVSPAKGALSSVGERIGSVVIAVGPADTLRLAERIATSTFVLALVGSA